MTLSIVIPCYNEGAKMLENIKTVTNKLNSLNIDYNVTIVNDGSTDNTLEYLNQIKYPHVFIETYEKNRGKGYAVKRGILSLFENNRAGDLINFMDADLSTDLSAIDTTLKHSHNYDIIIGSRRHKDTILPEPQGPIRKFIGEMCLIITKIMIGLNLKDTQCGFKTFQRDIIFDIVQKQQIEKFAFDVEYLYIAKLHNYTIKEIPIIWKNDTDSKVSTVKSSIKFFRDLFAIRKNKKLYKQ